MQTLSPTMVLVDVLGAVALLLLGLRMVRTGVVRGGGAEMRRWVARSTSNRFLAWGVGLVMTMAVQSSTATALLTSAMVGQGMIASAMALAVMLGADVGTSLTARLLAFDLHWLSPSLLLIGMVLHGMGEGYRRRRALGRVIIGLGMMLLALRLLGMATTPMREAPLMQALLSALGAEPFFAMVVAAIITAILHSSLAVVLLVAALAGAGVVEPAAALALVVGANLGGAIPPLLATARAEPIMRRVPLGNLIMRGIGAPIAILALVPIKPLVAGFDPIEVTVYGHIAFNLALTLLFLPLIGPITRLTERLLPDTATVEDAGKPRHLDETALDEPPVAISAALRETLRLGDLVEDMLMRSLPALLRGEETHINAVCRTEDQVNKLHTAIKLYLARLGRGRLDDEEGRRVNDIMSFVINLEHVGDIIDKNLMETANKRMLNGFTYTTSDITAVEELHRRTVENLRTALATLIGEDRRLARQLISGKEEVRGLERRAAARHLERVRRGDPTAMETSTLVLDILRDLKRINGHVASAAHPILDKAGELQDSRLRDLPAEAKAKATDQGAVGAGSAD